MAYHEISKNGVDAADALDFPDPPAPAFPRIILQTTVEHEGYTFVVTFNDTSIADAVAVLKRRGCTPAGKEHAPAHGAQAGDRPGVVPEADIPPAPPVCPIHTNRSMKPMKFADKQGHVWMCTARDGDTYCVERA